MPTVASYCTVFLKPEMQHIYRQITGTKRYQNVVITKTRQHAETFPYELVSILSKSRVNLVKRFYLKYLRRLHSLVYRGEFEVLQNALEAIRPDVLHIYFGHSAVHLSPFLELTNLPYVVSFHGADVMPRSDRPGYTEKLKNLLQVIPLVLARSESLATRLKNLGCPPEKIRINRTGIPLDYFKLVDRSSRVSQPLRFIQACRLIEKKGLTTTIAAFALARKQLPGSILVIAGEGPLHSQLAQQVAQLGLAPYVQFIGFLDQAALREWYANSDIFVHPSEITAASDQEGVPNSLLEAMATGLPVLSTLHGGIPEAVENGVTGWLVPEKDVAALAEKMIRLGVDSAERATMGRAGADSVRMNFEQTAQIAQLESYYDEAIRISATQNQK